MYKIIDRRGTGKTSRLMLLAKETGATIICANPSAFYTKADYYGIPGLKFISYQDFWDGNFDPNDKFLVDEIEFLFRCYNKNIIGFNMSMENENEV